MAIITDFDDDNSLLTFNGIDATTGSYLFEPVKSEVLAEAIKPKTSSDDHDDRAHLADLRVRKARKDEAHLGVKEGIDPAKLEEAGWGVVFAAVAPGSVEARQQEAIYEALTPLLRLRQSQAAKVKEHYYQEYRGENGYHRGDTKQKFLADHEAGAGPADPEVVPYYLLLVGSPEEIPFYIQYQLDVQYAVGRIHFDSVAEYANYAQSVVLAETGGLVLPREIAFVGVSNYGDNATRLSRRRLVGPLADWAEARGMPDWKISRYFDEDATKANISQLFGGPKTPALLFTGSHGVGFKKGNPLQERRQGALILQDWPGPLTGAIGEDLYLSGDDITTDAKLAGLITFHFACYGAGTPEHNEFTKPGSPRVPIADRPFVAGLPKKLLSHPKGGALASIGHIERAWGSSFGLVTGKERESTQHIAVFESTLGALMNGMPVGAALEYFNQRYAEMASDLNIAIADEFGLTPTTPTQLANMYTSSRDARGYAIIGDPAVRLPLGTGITTTNDRSRETLELSSMTLTALPPAEPSPPAPAGPSEKPGAAAVGILESLQKLLVDKTPIDVRTYASHDGADASQNDPVAHTRIHFDGSVETIVPLQGNAVDTALWNAHMDMVKQAQVAHLEMIKVILTSVPTPEKP